jgi:hypothetical protein
MPQRPGWRGLGIALGMITTASGSWVRVLGEPFQPSGVLEVCG